MRAKDDIAKWQAKVTDLEQQMDVSPSPKIAEMLSDARNYLRYVKARHEDMSKQSS